MLRWAGRDSLSLCCNRARPIRKHMKGGHHYKIVQLCETCIKVALKLRALVTCCQSCMSVWELVLHDEVPNAFGICCRSHIPESIEQELNSRWGRAYARIPQSCLKQGSNWNREKPESSDDENSYISKRKLWFHQSLMVASLLLKGVSWTSKRFYAPSRCRHHHASCESQFYFFNLRHLWHAQSPPWPYKSQAKF